MTWKVEEEGSSQRLWASPSRRMRVVHGEVTLSAAGVTAIVHLELGLKNGVAQECGSAQEGVGMELTEHSSLRALTRLNQGSSRVGGRRLRRRWCGAMVRGRTVLQLVGRVPFLVPSLSPSPVLFLFPAHRNCVRAEVDG